MRVILLLYYMRCYFYNYFDKILYKKSLVGSRVIVITLSPLCILYDDPMSSISSPVALSGIFLNISSFASFHV